MGLSNWWTFWFNSERGIPTIAHSLGIEDTFPSEDAFRRRKRKKQFDYEADDENEINPENNFKINFFFTVLDVTINALTGWFEQLQAYVDNFDFFSDFKIIKTI